MSKNRQPTTPEPPLHLRRAGRHFWITITSEFVVAPDQLPLLQGCCEALDLAAAARRTIRKEGMTIKNDRTGSYQRHPALVIHKDAWATFSKLRRELGVDHVEPEAPRPPKPKGYR
jgi:P27 family predicted phage terminase small subunit